MDEFPAKTHFAGQRLNHSNQRRCGRGAHGKMVEAQGSCRVPSTICVEVLDVQLVGKNLDGWLFKGNVGDIYRDLKICLAIEMIFGDCFRII